VPPPPEKVRMRRGTSVVEAPIDKVDDFSFQGYRPENIAETQTREAGTRALADAPGAVATFLGKTLGTMTLGASDWEAGRDPVQRRLMAAGREVHGLASGLGAVAGIAATMGAGGPGDLAGRVVGVGGGLGRAAAREALVGAMYNTGGYVSDTALGDRELTAQGFLGAGAIGAAFGGLAAGALGLAEQRLINARRLFAGADLTKEAVQSAEHDAVGALGELRNDADIVGQSARERMRGIRTELRSDPMIAAEHDAVAQRAAAERSAEITPTIQELAPVAPAPGSADDLLAKLHGTKARLDAGESIGSIRSVEDAVNRHVGETHGEMARIVRAERELADAGKGVDDLMAKWRDRYQGGVVDLGEMTPAARRQAMREWAEDYTPKTATESAVRESTLAPKTSESLGRLGGETFPEETQAAAKAASRVAARQGYLGELPMAAGSSKSGAEVMAKATYEGKRAAARAADDVYTSAIQGPNLNDRLAGMLKASEPAEMAPHEIQQGIDAIGRLESAHADTVEALGPHAPPASIPKAQALRAAEAAKASSATESAVAGGKIAQRTPGLMDKAKGLFEKYGEVSEFLHLLGVPVPNASHIPVIGPILSTFLKAKIGARLLKGGLKTGATVESSVAARSAGVRNAIAGHIDRALNLAAKGVSRARPYVAAPASLIGQSLLQHSGIVPHSEKTEGEAFLARKEELMHALAPGVIEESIRNQVRTADPGLLSNLIETKTRQLDFLREKLPKPSWPELDAKSPWLPDQIRQAAFARYVNGMVHPASVFEKMAKGQMPSSEELESVRVGYPRLLMEAQQRVINEIASKGHEFDHAGRVRLGVQLGVPLDRGLAPDFGMWAQQGYQPKPPPPPIEATGSTKGGNIELGKMSTPRVDRDRMGA